VGPELERPPLNETALRQALVAPAGPYDRVDVIASLPSTNTALAAAACAGTPPDRTVLIAEHQTDGRGRADRSWVAPARSGLTLSVLLRPTAVAQARWGWLPLLAGVALCRAVTELGAVRAALKWPNDLLLGAGARKAAGILAEVVPGPAVVLGIGLNVSLRPDELPTPEATSLVIERAACTDRDPLLRALLRTLDTKLATWSAHGGDADAAGLRDAYRRHCVTLGRAVRVELPGKPALTGTAVDVDPEGRLVVSSDGQRRAVSAGDVTHVRPG
jgi:BirA family transcriptional regulator, biotin operon repressor / biotin---[acetyl-CoA-carboxylase] ligase